ncbi:unnamed protein product [Ixodes hexagonus]
MKLLKVPRMAVIFGLLVVCPALTFEPRLSSPKPITPSKLHSSSEKSVRLSLREVYEKLACNEDRACPTDMIFKRFDNMTHSAVPRCDCKRSCVDYGSCCLGRDLGYTYQEPVMSCRMVRLSNNTASSIYMKTRCARDWHDRQVRADCEDSAVEGDPFLDIPVTSRSTNITYRNVRCAVCNRDFNVKMWKAFLRSISGERPKSCSPKSDPSGCPLFLGCPDFMHNHKPQQYFRVCRSDVISDCPADIHSRNKQLREGCHIYFAPVTDQLTRVTYKNPFCASCYGVQLGDMRCPEDTLVDYPSTGWDEESIPEEEFLPSYALLIDVDFARGGAKVGLEDRCAPNQAYDPWKERCRNLVCGQLYEEQEGRCVVGALMKAYNSAVHHKLLASNCSKVALDKDEFILWENYTTTLRNGDLLVPGEYELVHNNSILICAFSARMSMYKFKDIGGYFTLTGSIVSLSCLLIKMCLYFFTSRLKNVPDHFILMLSASIFAAQLLFLFILIVEKYETLCIVIGLLVHYFFLASFFWTNALAFDLWRSFVTIAQTRKKNRVKTLCAFNTYCWTMPFFVVCASGGADFLWPRHLFSPGYGEGICWISNRMALLLFFAAPIATIVFSNMVLFAMSVVRISGTMSRADQVRHRASKGRLLIYFKLALVMGMTWTFGFVAPFANIQALWYVFVILNSLQGAFVLFAFTKLEVRAHLETFATWLRRASDHKRSSSSKTIVSGH